MPAARRLAASIWRCEVDAGCSTSVSVPPRDGASAARRSPDTNASPASRPPARSNATMPPKLARMRRATAWSGWSGSPGQYTCITPRWPASCCARWAAFAQCRSIRSPQVMTTTLPASHRTSKPGHPGRAARRGVSPLAMRTTRVSMQIRLEPAIMASMVTQRYTTNTIRSQSLPSVAEYHARLSGSAWLDRPGHDTYLVPAGGFRLAQRTVSRADEFGQRPPGPVEDSDADGHRQPEHKPSVASVLDCDRLSGDVIAQPFRDPPGLGFPGLRQQDRELLTTEPPDETRFLQVLGQGASDAPENLIARIEPRRFVHAAEVVYVDHD